MSPGFNSVIELATASLNLTLFGAYRRNFAPGFAVTATCRGFRILQLYQ
jgi:hypothetical protein